MTKKTETRTQYRAFCPICFREHALRDDLYNLVQHGYVRPEGWHQNVSECSGTNRPHFGTERGRDLAASNAAFIRDHAKSRRADAATLESNPPAKVVVSGPWNRETKKYAEETVGPSDYRYDQKLRSLIASCESDARHADSTAAEIEKRVREWKAAEPRPVEVATGPTLHAIGAYWTKRAGRPIALCASSSRGDYKQTTPDRAKVTCKTCLKSLAASDASAVELTAAQNLIAEMVAKYGPSVATRFSDANDKAIKEIRYHRKEVDKNVRKRASDLLERGQS